MITAGSTAVYCANNPCNVGAPACSGTAYTFTTPGYQVSFRGDVSCTHVMDYINIHLSLVRSSTGATVLGPYHYTCHAAEACYLGMHGWGLPSGCYRARLAWDSRYTDPVTNAITHFGNTTTSGYEVCV